MELIAVDGPKGQLGILNVGKEGAWLFDPAGKGVKIDVSGGHGGNGGIGQDGGLGGYVMRAGGVGGDGGDGGNGGDGGSVTILFDSAAERMLKAFTIKANGGDAGSPGRSGGGGQRGPEYGGRMGTGNNAASGRDGRGGQPGAGGPRERLERVDGLTKDLLARLAKPGTASFKPNPKPASESTPDSSARADAGMTKKRETSRPKKPNGTQRDERTKPEQRVVAEKLPMDDMFKGTLKVTQKQDGKGQGKTTSARTNLQLHEVSKRKFEVRMGGRCRLQFAQSGKSLRMTERTECSEARGSWNVVREFRQGRGTVVAGRKLAFELKVSTVLTERGRAKKPRKVKMTETIVFEGAFLRKTQRR